jgi:hypothetical protein
VKWKLWLQRDKKALLQILYDNSLCFQTRRKQQGVDRPDLCQLAQRKATFPAENLQGHSTIYMAAAGFYFLGKGNFGHLVKVVLLPDSTWSGLLPDVDVDIMWLLTMTSWCGVKLCVPGDGDCVRCFHCGAEVRRWAGKCDAWHEHALASPDCPFLKLQKGEPYIDAVQRISGNMLFLRQVLLFFLFVWLISYHFRAPLVVRILSYTFVFTIANSCTDPFWQKSASEVTSCLMFWMFALQSLCRFFCCFETENVRRNRFCITW